MKVPPKLNPRLALTRRLNANKTRDMSYGRKPLNLAMVSTLSLTVDSPPPESSSAFQENLFDFVCGLGLKFEKKANGRFPCTLFVGRLLLDLSFTLVETINAWRESDDDGGTVFWSVVFVHPVKGFIASFVWGLLLASFLCVQAKFNIDWDLAEDWINKKIDHLWRQRKHKLKKEYEKPSKDKEKIAKLINDVGQVQWDWLVKFWNSEKGKDRAKTNKQNYGKLEIHQTGGTKSFARLRDELKKQDPEGNEPNKITIFKATHTRKNDKPIAPKVANAMRQMDELVTNQPDVSKNEIFNQVMGEVIGPKADVSTLHMVLGSLDQKKMVNVLRILRH
ncbi:hypothetical protein QYF36_020003 [Acer negundo]|nr:hypothetical protein QYF36_020003 [Acer negundo]